MVFSPFTIWQHCSAFISCNMNENNCESCAFCLEKALYCCSCCIVTHYCSMDCQNKHWFEHKQICRTIGDSGLSPTPIKLWRQTITPPINIFFEVMIQHLQDFNDNAAIAWVIETKHLPIFQRLSKKRKASLPNDLQPLQNIKTDMLVMSPAESGNGDSVYQRARLCHFNVDTQRAIIRFLDTGLSKLESITNLMPPTPEMERIMALAFNITLLSNDTKRLEKGCKIWIQILGIKSQNGCYRAVQMPEFFGFPFAIAGDKTKIKVIQIFDCNQAALCRAIDVDDTAAYNVDDDIETLTASPGEGSYILALHAKEWQRGRLIGWSEFTNIPHLVYLFDLGKMCFCKTLKPLSAKYQKKVMKAFVVNFESADIKLTAAALNFTDLSIIVDKKAMQSKVIDNYAPSLPCQVYQGEKLFGNVQAQNFTGFLESIGCKYWKEIINDDTVVVIKSIVNEKWVTITPAWTTSKYRQLFDTMADLCVPMTGVAIEELDYIFLAYNIEDKSYFRAKYISHNEDDDQNEEMIQVIDIDTGNICYVHLSQLRELNRFLWSCPVYLTYIELSEMKSFKTVSEDSKIFKALSRCSDNATEFILKYEKYGFQQATLYYRNDSKRSLNAELVEILKSEEELLNNSMDTPNNDQNISNEIQFSQNLNTEINISQPTRYRLKKYSDLIQQSSPITENNVHIVENQAQRKQHRLRRYSDLIKQVTT